MTRHMFATFFVVLSGLVLPAPQHLRAQSVQEFLRTNPRIDFQRGTALHVDYFLQLPLPLPQSDPYPVPSGRPPRPTRPVNLNVATTQELTAIPGIDEELARRIIDYRNKAGTFTRVEDLLLVRGIDQRLYQRIRGWCRATRSPYASWRLPGVYPGKAAETDAQSPAGDLPAPILQTWAPSVGLPAVQPETQEAAPEPETAPPTESAPSSPPPAPEGGRPES